jgi:hypothetical protein
MQAITGWKIVEKMRLGIRRDSTDWRGARAFVSK